MENKSIEELQEDIIEIIKYFDEKLKYLPPDIQKEFKESKYFELFEKLKNL